MLLACLGLNVHRDLMGCHVRLQAQDRGLNSRQPCNDFMTVTYNVPAQCGTSCIDKTLRVLMRLYNFCVPHFYVIC